MSKPIRLAEYIEESPFEAPSITEEQRREVLEMTSKFNQYREHLGTSDKNLIEMANEMGKIVHMAEQFCMSEAGSWFDSGMIQKDMKRLKEDAKAFYKVAQGVQSQRDQLNGLYENIGGILNRYFDIHEIEQNPTASTVNPQQQNRPQRPNRPVQQHSQQRQLPQRPKQPSHGGNAALRI